MQAVEQLRVWGEWTPCCPVSLERARVEYRCGTSCALPGTSQNIKVLSSFITWPFYFWGAGAVLWNHNYFLRFRFLFRFQLLKSFGSGSGSDFRKSYGSSSGSYFRKVKVPVPVPVPAPYLDHKKQIFQKNFGKILPFYIVSCFTRKKFLNFNKFL